MGAEPNEAPRGTEHPRISHESIDQIAENEVLGKNISLFGQDTTSQQLPPNDANETFKTLQKEDPSFKEKIPPFAGVMLFATTSLGKDSQRRMQEFLTTKEAARDAQIRIGAKWLKIEDPELAADAMIAVRAAILLGYSAPADILSTFASKNRWGFAVFPELLMSKDFRESRKNLLDEIARVTKQYAEYTETPGSADFHNIGPADIMKGGTYETIKLLNQTKDPSGLEIINGYGKKHAASLESRQAEDPLGLNYAVLKGFLMAQARFENATRLYQTMTNTS